MISTFLATLRLRDALDVVLVAVVVYRVLVMFKGTRTFQMLVGLGMLVIVSILAQRLELRSLDWILHNFWSFWAIAIVVLFQPELRRALARAGQGGLIRTLLGTSRAERAQVAGELAGVAQSLAARRIGALVILERSGGLAQYAELGVPLDAVVTADLVESIFLPSSPLHDGAVVIQGTRLVAAGCFLPLSRNLEIGRTLGTRHRAGLGITEETDAVALIVSEETGRCSLAVEGRLESGLDGDRLRERLAALLEGEAAAGAPAALWRGVRRRVPRTPGQA